MSPLPALALITLRRRALGVGRDGLLGGVVGLEHVHAVAHVHRAGGADRSTVCATATV